MLTQGAASPSYLLPHKNKASKRKTPVVKKTLNPHYNHTFVYNGINPEDLQHICLELTVWDREPLSSNDFLGSVRLGVGNGEEPGAHQTLGTSSLAGAAVLRAGGCSGRDFFHPFPRHEQRAGCGLDGLHGRGAEPVAEDVPVSGLLGRGDTPAPLHHGQAEAVGCGTGTGTTVRSHTCCTAWQGCQMWVVFFSYTLINMTFSKQAWAESLLGLASFKGFFSCHKPCTRFQAELESLWTLPSSPPGKML